MASNLWGSALSFKHGVREKLSFVLLNQLDLLLTSLVLPLHLTELNPWVRELLATPFKLVLVKLAIPLLLAWVVPGKFLLPASALLLGIVAWNLKELIALL